MNKQEIEILSDYFSHDEPFGPIDAEEIENPKALAILFEHHNKIYAALRQRPSIVVGRKGSGKTSYLNSVYFDETYKYKIELDTSEALTSVINAVSQLTKGPVFSKTVAKIWENILITGLFSEIRSELNKNYKSKKLINDYLAKIGIRDAGTFDDVLWKITDIISEKSSKSIHGLAAEILRALDNVTFIKTKKILFDELKENKVKAVILLDSLDDFQLHLSDVARAIQGLLKFIGSSNKPSVPLDIRFCLPAELYHLFVNLSSNPNKDFKRRLLLHWVASELVMVAAHRMTLYGEIYEDYVPQNVVRASLNNKDDAQTILHSILPDKVTCKLDVDENPLAYILRHTQLLPRHLLIILNSICDKNKKYQENSESLKIDEVAIRKGIREVEGTIVQEIFIAFDSQYPNARKVCEACIPELHHKFSLGDLQIVFRTHGKKAMGTDDFDDFKSMLIEIGAIGRVMDDSGRYIQAEFEYTVPNKLVTSTDDLLCFHPLFAEIFNAKIRDRKPVYPYGSRIEDKDYRSM